MLGRSDQYHPSLIPMTFRVRPSCVRDLAARRSGELRPVCVCARFGFGALFITPICRTLDARAIYFLRAGARLLTVSMHEDHMEAVLCARLQEVVHAPEPFGLDDCARFDEDPECCAAHRVLEQPCKYVRENASCHQSYPDAAMLIRKRLEYGRGVRGTPCIPTAAMNLQPPRLPRPCATRPVVAKTAKQAASLKAIWLQVPHRKDLTYSAEWRPHTSPGGRWEWSACEGKSIAAAWLNHTKQAVVIQCVRPGDQSRNAECPLRFCRKREGRHSCTAQSAAKLVKFHCAARTMPPDELVHLISSKPVFIGRSGNGELQRLAAGLSLMSQNLMIRDLFKPPERLWQDKALSFLFNHGRPGDRRVAMQYFATLRSEMGTAMERFFLEYASALAAQDVELFWEDQCHTTIFLRCALSTLGRETKVARAAPELAASASKLSQMGSMVHYNVSLDYWLEVLEQLARRRTRLLIVTGFSASVEYQIPRLHLIHPRRNLSGLAFRVLAAPMQEPRMGTPGWPLPNDPKEENYGTHLDKLTASKEWDPKLNDVAMLGCGPLGMPLSKFARGRGISAIYVGGLIQLLFGIAGRRYLEKVTPSEHEVGGLAVKVFQRQGLVNEHWIRPLDSETPRLFREVEGGAYWRRMQ